MRAVKKNGKSFFWTPSCMRSGRLHFFVEQRMNILGHEYRDGNIYLIFQDPEINGRTINLTEVNAATQSIKQHTFKPEVNMRFTNFIVVKGKAIFGGYITREPALLMYDTRD
ncbi:MAG: hypothetical protein QM734_08780 [Cyclobacteriaceae bacterium]